MSESISGYYHRFVGAKDPGAAPTLLLLHGTGGDEDDLMPLARMLLPRANVLSPRGPVNEQGASRFFRRLAEGVFDLEDLRRRTGDLIDFVRASALEYGFDVRHLTAVGFSNGANIAASVLLTEPQVFRAAALFRAMTPFEPAHVRSLHGVDVFLAAGRTDPIIPAANTERLATLLAERGATVDLQWIDGGHGLTQADVTLAKAWIETVIPSEAAQPRERNLGSRE
jgi:phospholipase/carboxylesterase